MRTPDDVSAMLALKARGWGSKRIAQKVFFFVATLGYSRRLHVRAFPGEKQEHGFEGVEGAFRSFGGVPEEVLLDNARALITHHHPVSREVVVNPRLHAFARHRGFRVRACAPYRARTKGEDERGQHQDRNTALRPQASADRETIFARHHHVEHHKIEPTRLQRRVHRHGIGGRGRAHAVSFEILHQRLADLAVIIDDQDMRRVGRHHVSLIAAWPIRRAAWREACRKPSRRRCLRQFDTKDRPG